MHHLRVRSTRRGGSAVGILVAAALVVLTTAGVLAHLGASASVAISVQVVGNHLVDATGATMQLRGVDRSGTEFACTGDSGSDGWSTLDTPGDVTDQQSVAAMASWDINAVRIPLNEDCWLGINGVPAAYSGANYRNAVYAYVQLLHSYGMVAILDLHYNAPGTQVSDSTDGPYGIGQQVMADASHAPAFWASVATTFLSDRGVIFDLYNEPFDISWSCWLNGGCTAPAVGGTSGGWQVAGMQSLVDAVRGTGATQPIMVGGLNYANDLSGWMTHEPTDTVNPPQIIASVHVYDGESCATEACWNSTFAPVAAKVPVVTGEFGPSSCDGTFVDAYMAWSDANGISYLAWNWGSTDDGWSCADSPALLEHDDGTPDAYGAAVEAHYRAVAAAVTSSTTTTTTTTVPTVPTTTQLPTPDTISPTTTPLSPPVTTSSTVTPTVALRTSRLVDEDGAVHLSAVCTSAPCSGSVQLIEKIVVRNTIPKRTVVTATEEVLASHTISIAKISEWTVPFTSPHQRFASVFACERSVALSSSGTSRSVFA
jgi:hypothetical protein